MARTETEVLREIEDAIERNNSRDMLRLLREYDGKDPITFKQFKTEYGADTTREEWRDAIREECESLISSILHDRE